MKKMPDKEPKVVTISQEHLFAFILANIRAKKNPDNIVPNDKAHWKAFKEVVLPKEGGIYTHYWDDKYPQKGFPFNETVEKVNDIKKMVMALLYGFDKFKGKWLIGIFYLLFRKRILISFTSVLIQMDRMLAFHRLNPIRYCPSVREVYQAIPANGNYSRLKNVVCMILEFDDAYRYRFQYTLGQINKDDFKKNPYAELSRALVKMQESEIDERLRKMWKMLEKFLWLSFFFKVFRQGIINIIGQMDLEKVKLDEADRYYAKMHHNLFANN